MNVSSGDGDREKWPAFERPDGPRSYGEEPTVPLNDVRSSNERGAGESPYASSVTAEPTIPIVAPVHGASHAEHTVPLDDVRNDAMAQPASSHGFSQQEHTVPISDPYPYSAPAAPDLALPVVDLYSPAAHADGASPAGGAFAGDYWRNPSDDSRGYGPVAPYPAVEPQPEYQQWVQQQQIYSQPPGQYRLVPAEHPQATTVLVLGAISVGVPFLSFVAWYMGSKAKKEIGRGAPYPYSGNLKIGHILGKVIGIITIVGASLYALFLIAYMVIMLTLLFG